MKRNHTIPKITETASLYIACRDQGNAPRTGRPRAVSSQSRSQLSHTSEKSEDRETSSSGYHGRDHRESCFCINTGGGSISSFAFAGRLGVPDRWRFCPLLFEFKNPSIVAAPLYAPVYLSTPRVSAGRGGVMARLSRVC